MDTQLDILQASVEDKNTLMTRLKGEAAVMERNLGLKSAALLSAETNLSARDKEREAMKKELAAQTESLFQALKKIKACEVTIEALEAELLEKSNNYEIEKKNAETKENNLIQKHENQITEIKLNSEERMEAMKKENSKKSSLARTLLTEREEENRFLRAKNEELVLEIKSGSPNDRRIFELAEIQAKREAVHGQHG
jgi:chromosome segregation ATPase